MLEGLQRGCCSLVYNLKDDQEPTWLLSIQVNSEISLVLNLFDSLVLFGALTRSFNGERFASIESDILKAQEQGSRWDFIRQLTDEKTNKTVFSLCREPILVSIDSQHMAKVFADLRNLFMAVLNQEPTLSGYLPDSVCRVFEWDYYLDRLQEIKKGE